MVLFVVLVSGVIWSTWQFMQSELFASYAAKRLTSYISNQTNLTVEFERIEFQLYPIGSVLKSVEVLSQNDTGVKNIYASEIGFYFDFLDFFSNKITIESVRIVSAEVTFSENFFDSDSKNKNKKSFIEEVKTELRKINHQMIANLVRSNLPIELESLEFVDSIIRFGRDNYDLSHASVSIFNKLTEVKAKVEDLNLRKLGVPLLSDVDSVEIDLQISNDDFRIKKFEIMQELSKLMVSGKVQNSDGLPLELKVEFESGAGVLLS